MSNNRPNILVIQADQLAAKYLGAYGYSNASTPHIDSLAASGSLFESAYTNFPLCAPSRFSKHEASQPNPQPQATQSGQKSATPE